MNTKQAINPNYKTKKCAQFHEVGYCPYGTRCQFLHKDVNSDHNKTKNYFTSPDTKFCGKSIINKQVCYKNLYNNLMSSLSDDKNVSNNNNEVKIENIILSPEIRTTEWNDNKSHRLKIFTEISNENTSQYIKKRSRANTDHGDWSIKKEYRNNQEFNIHESEKYNDFLDFNNFEENIDVNNNFNNKNLKLTNKMSVTKEVDLELEQKYSNILDEEYEKEVNTKNYCFDKEYFDNTINNEYNKEYKKLKELNDNLKKKSSKSNEKNQNDVDISSENSSKSFNSKIFFDERIMFENEDNEVNENYINEDNANIQNNDCNI